MIEIRPATSEEMPEVARLASRSIGMTAAMFTGMPPEWTLCAFDDGKLATTYAAWPFTIRFNGNGVPVAAVTWVSTHPVYRRRGNLRRITRQHFEQMHEQREASMAALHPSLAAIYQRYGYGIISTRYTYRVDPQHIVFAHPLETPGTLREVDLDSEFGLLVEVYRAFREDRNGLVHRGRARWDAGVLSDAGPGMRQNIVAYEEDGDPLGYAIYYTGPGRFGGPAPGQALVLEDLSYTSAAAYRALWEHLANFDMVREIRWPYAAPDDPLQHLILEPRMLSATAHDGIMARIVTVEDALTLRPYPASAELRFELADDFCPWNAGRWRLETSETMSEMTRIDGIDVDVTMTPDTLAMLVWGQISASEAARMGRLDVHDPAALPRWDAAMRTRYRPHEAENTW